MSSDAAISLQQQATIDQLANRKRWIDRNIDNGCLTASAFGHALGLKGLVHHYVHYLRQQVGTKEEFKGNSATFHGQRTENISKMVYEVLCCGGRTVDDGGFYPAITKETGAGHLACSPDGIVSWYDEDNNNIEDAAATAAAAVNDNDIKNKNKHSADNATNPFPSDFTRSNRRRPKRLLEIKSPIARIYNGAYSDQTPHGIPKAYMCQIQGQIYMTGAEDCDFFVYVAKHPPSLALWRVKPCQEFWDWMMPKLLQVCEWISVKPKSVPTEEIVPRDFRFDDFPDWGVIPVEGIYCPTNMVSGDPLKDHKAFPFFFQQIKIPGSTAPATLEKNKNQSQNQQQQQQKPKNIYMTKLITGSTPDREKQIFTPMMRIFVVRNLREGDWVLWTKNSSKQKQSKSNIISNVHHGTLDRNQRCFCCGSAPRLLMDSNNSQPKEKLNVDDEDAAAPQQKEQEAETQEEETFILRVLTVHPDLNKIEAEIHYFGEDLDEDENDECNNNSDSDDQSQGNQQHDMSLTPARKSSQQQKDEENVCERLIKSCPVCGQEKSAGKAPSRKEQRRVRRTRTIFVEPTVQDEMSVIRRKARPVRDEIRYWKEAMEAAKESKKQALEDKEVKSNTEDQNSEDKSQDTPLKTANSSKEESKKESEEEEKSKSLRRFFTTTAIQLIIQLWNDPIKVLLRSPTCKTINCLESSLKDLRLSIGGNLLRVSPRGAACLWHVVSLLEKEEIEKLERERLKVEAMSSTSTSTSTNSSPSSSFSMMSNKNKGNLRLITSSQDLRSKIKEMKLKSSNLRLWLEDSFVLSTVCHKMLLAAIQASGSVQEHVLVNQVCAVMTVTVFNHLLNENRFSGHQRRRASPLLPPPNPRNFAEEALVNDDNGNAQNTLRPSSSSNQTRNYNNNNKPPLFPSSSSHQSAPSSQNNNSNQQQKKKYKDYSPTEGSSAFPLRSKSSSPLLGIATPSSSFSSNPNSQLDKYNNSNHSSNNNSQQKDSNNQDDENNNAAQKLQQQQQLQDVWHCPIWIVCSDRDETTIPDYALYQAKGNAVDDDIGEIPDIYRLVEACADRGIEEVPWVWFVCRGT